MRISSTVPPRRCQGAIGSATDNARRWLTVLATDTLAPQRFTEVVTEQWESEGFAVRVDDDGEAVGVQATVEGPERRSASFPYGERYQGPEILITAVPGSFAVPERFDDSTEFRRQFDRLVDPATFGEPPS